jgi:MarR family transcriptional regulator, transcriptional regulator for hemolysin
MVNSPPPLAKHIVFTAKAMREAFEQALASAGGSLGSWVVLSALRDVGCVSQSVLATHVHLEGATITHHIDRLEAAGLVRRLLDPDDRRIRRLELTEAGMELHNRLLAAAIQLERRVMAGVGDAERTLLERTLERIEANLDSVTAERLPEHPPAG